jgi:hypothetical protein
MIVQRQIELNFYDVLIRNKYQLFSSMFLLELFVFTAIVLGSEPQPIVLDVLIVSACTLALRMSNTSESKKARNNNMVESGRNVNTKS